MEKSPEAFRTISEVADWLDVPAHVLRFWESRFSQIKPVKRAGGRRYYRPTDMLLIGGIKQLLHEDGMTIRAVQKLLREEGSRHVAALSQPLEHAMEPTSDADKRDAPSGKGLEIVDLTRAPTRSETADTRTGDGAAGPPAFGSVRSKVPELPLETPADDAAGQEDAAAPEEPATPVIPATPDVPDTDPADDADGFEVRPGLTARLFALDRLHPRNDMVGIEDVVRALREARDRPAS